MIRNAVISIFLILVFGASGEAWRMTLAWISNGT